MLRLIVKTLFVFLALFFLVTPSLAASQTGLFQIENEKQVKAIQQCPCPSSNQIDIARRGCCSHHGGVCGCDEKSDRIRCCDGTLSPTCKCSTY